ncbi:MAG: Asp-tRNA(Asn)/Glu-tRNA(Gln) amidotransferase subunit GatB [Burkholderiaceae bacterium]|nr:Asp-tRNA(Asn)/Glu-tRNA(Gln) amidotransferase subunit GatB [Burkholderiaceae bacterium]
MKTQWEAVIGLETHVQLFTRSKIFSPAPNAFGAHPNAQASVIDLALPGVLPVLNRTAVEFAIRLGCAVGGRIAERSIFARKNYFYPDLPKGYQISQYELPVVQGGAVACLVSPRSGEPYVKTVRLTRAHLEEDAGKSLHEEFAGQSGIDLNRAGTPLLEIVSEPDMRSSAEAIAYARALHALVVWLGICDGNMQEGSFRCDANVSVRPAGDDRLGTRVEVKNVNSFRFLQQAIEHEITRQIERIEDGGSIEQETRLYDPDSDSTRPMRSKEDAMDYRYFPDPDLLPLQIPAEWIEHVKIGLPELPEAMRARFASQYGLSAYDAALLTSSRALAQYFEAAARAAPDPKTVANWVNGEVSAALHAADLSIERCPVSPEQLAALLVRIADGTINQKTAKEVFTALWDGNAGSVDAYIEERGLRQISDAGEIETIVDRVLAANASMVAEYRAGKQKAFHALVGQTMKATGGKANPAQVNEILRRKLGG